MLTGALLGLMLFLALAWVWVGAYLMVSDDWSWGRACIGTLMIMVFFVVFGVLIFVPPS